MSTRKLHIAPVPDAATSEPTRTKGRAVQSSLPAPAPAQPLFLSVRAMCERLDISESTFHRVRDEDWLPRPIMLSPKVYRWNWAEVEQALRERAPRLVLGANPEPEKLASVRTGRKFRSGAPA